MLAQRVWDTACGDGKPLQIEWRLSVVSFLSKLSIFNDNTVVLELGINYEVQFDEYDIPEEMIVI